MIVQCPKCQTELALDMKHLDEDTALVCRGCRSILKTKIVVEILVEKGAHSSKSPSPQNEGTASPERSKPAETPARTVEALQEDPLPAAVDPQKVLVAIDGEGTKEMIKELLSGASFKVVEANSGKEILPLLNQQRPAIALIDVGLPDGLGSEFCSMIKKDDRLKETIVILMASIYEKNNKYRRQPSSLFGADDYIERHHIEKDLLVRIRKHLDRKQNGDSPAAPPRPAETSKDPSLRETSMPSLEETARTRRPEMESIPPAIDQGRTLDVEQSTRPALEKGVPPPAVEPGSEKAPEPKEHEDARRLARIIVSDIVLYNKKKVEEGLRSNRFYELLKEEIEEGKKHYDSRVPPEVQKVRDFYKEAFEDFIRKKKG
ncbi:response regulator [Candidatus Manganitrophus noduliformans]|uniref:Response regulator n=1 Tax=Candidatus Manganitrophus noduliformans TaxID=2606439 RepID=A0A7X6ICB5_9BACT|nr:response regulator [Candidatus Manganitrophus noduliformans]NKE72310.1 response regulator [Candidatus Manganitrophus noduliformans]